MASSTSLSRSQRPSTISPFRSRKSPGVSPASRPNGRPTTPSSTVSSRPPSKVSVSPMTTASCNPSPSTPALDRFDVMKAKENVTVTVRFRPLSVRELNKGDEIAWYADGEYTVRNEFNSSIAYGFDRVFGPATTTRHVYDVAAHQVVAGAMNGINGTVFAYGVTSSGKTHTMHGEQKSPGVIPLAVKDVFGIIQETPERQFLLRVSYLEIYNEVINDLLDPTGQNLRVREDAQGTYVEGIKEEVVLSPAHALSLIASGEEHRHVGSNNFNLLSSRSHTIFTLTIESSPHGEHHGEEDVTLSQLHLIDLAGSESSKTETTGLRRKEGSYINKSLLTLGTVISKLTDEKATHIPYRDSKLTRLLQSSLSGHGRISLICTVTPASSNSEETHNTLKFAHRSKRVEIKASQNKIIDEKSLIKKYQREISSLKQELQQLKRGIMENPSTTALSTQEDLVNLKLQLEADQVKLQSRLEEEEEAKAALMGRIQRLTKLILVSTKNALPSSVAEKPGQRRRHSFGEDELAYLPDRKRDYLNDDDGGSCASGISVDGRDDVVNLDDLVKDMRSNKKRGMLGWFKIRKPENPIGPSSTIDTGSSTGDSPASRSKASQNRMIPDELKNGRRTSICRKGDDSSIIYSSQERTQAGDLFGATMDGYRLPPTGTTLTDQMDLLCEQVKMLAGEVALCTSSLKRLSEQAARNPEDSQIKEHVQKLKDEISEKKLQIRVLEQRMIGSVEMSPQMSSSIELSQALSKLTAQLNEKIFELEIKSADNRILQEQLQMKAAENAELQEAILRVQQESSCQNHSSNSQKNEDDEASQHLPNYSIRTKVEARHKYSPWEDKYAEENTPTSVMSLNRVLTLDDSKACNSDKFSHSQVMQAEIENLKQEKVRLIEEKEGLEIQSRKLSEEASYAKELASAAAIELQNLAEEVTRLSYENAKLAGDRTNAKDSYCRSCCAQRFYDSKHHIGNARYQREAALEKAIFDRDQREAELYRRLEEAKRHEEDMENELANMWGLFAKMRKSELNIEDMSFEGVRPSYLLQGRAKNGYISSNGISDGPLEDDVVFADEMRAGNKKERIGCRDVESFVSQMKV
ncbi:kinesin-related protein 4 isoform X1 [Cucumis melo var. makuwa]|uniref:Kinesin-related protein 4 isoform X1 n=2 Tax=Cucumis melo TaxID=3656 RepID=A0A5A7UJS8_CUCMM|nr:kinesin-related protein 4 isoform X1 [Cucumis melo var. makuwa]TYK08932.1 kinesin-related protein 4 isoform X1 [Cucumis melo var. makuwa]